jgi:hypothetical protein
MTPSHRGTQKKSGWVWAGLKNPDCVLFWYPYGSFKCLHNYMPKKNFIATLCFFIGVDIKCQAFCFAGVNLRKPHSRIACAFPHNILHTTGGVGTARHIHSTSTVEHGVQLCCYWSYNFQKKSKGRLLPFYFLVMPLSMKKRCA